MDSDDIEGNFNLFRRRAAHENLPPKRSKQSFDDYINEVTETYSDENRENTENISVKNENGYRQKCYCNCKEFSRELCRSSGLPSSGRNFNRVIQSFAFLPAEAAIEPINTSHSNHKPRTDLCDVILVNIFGMACSTTLTRVTRFRQYNEIIITKIRNLQKIGKSELYGGRQNKIF
ncbi:hypothetical protein Glove_155g51 [Diversispora epigaea]|uniref:Uncharacterized protein n=1 Tax=Diversispora epigaea TaxID=1348612 RepID=A0A397IWZ5_9GLOM|nr:hypothetical protein Glove_155g51 [Diversispora epigaea]